MPARDVKNTIVMRLLDTIAPHYCCSCGQIGSLFCESCKYDIISDPILVCMVCRSPLNPDNRCSVCVLPCQKMLTCTIREEGSERLLNEFKFMRAQAGAETIADMLAQIAIGIPKYSVIVPVPTTSSHRRMRGYDHTLLIAQSLARRVGLEVEQILQRRHNLHQVGSSRKQRIEQAKTAFSIEVKCDPETVYILIDDIITTGSTMMAAAQVLRDAGAQQVWCIAFALQPDKKGRQMPPTRV